MIPKPERFHPEDAPPGFETKFVSFWRERPKITPRLQLVHTNGASRQGSIEAAYKWANQPGSGHTIPHFQIDRDGRGCLMLPLDRKGIANYKAADFSIGIETADTGYLDDPAISAFTPAQAHSVALALAWAAWGYNIPLEYPTAWDGPGTACHTEPFAYPYWTNAPGKICPGLKKKAQMRDLILPHARQILAEWNTPEPPPPPPPDPPPTTTQEDLMLPAIAKTTDGANLAQFTFRGPIYTVGDSDAHDVTQAEVFGRGGGKAYNIVDRNIVSWTSPENTGSFGAVKPTKTVAEVRALMAGEA